MKIIPIRTADPEPEELLPPEQWKIAEEARLGNRHCMRGLAEIYESMWHRALLPDARHENLRISPDRLFLLAFRWRLKAAEAGDAESMRWLSVYMVRYAEDYHITEDMAGGKSALMWQQASAEAGDKYAMKWMGDVCADPYYEHFNQKDAIDWYTRSAKAGCVYAMHELGDRYLNGIGVTKDTEEAIHWYKECAGRLSYWRDLSGIEIRMTMEDVSTAGDLMLKAAEEEEPADFSETLEWIRAHLDLAAKLSERIAVSPEITKKLRKTRMKLNGWL